VPEIYTDLFPIILMVVVLVEEAILRIGELRYRERMRG
jgi:hypothetical protein